jgi:hypothetical protein
MDGNPTNQHILHNCLKQIQNRLETSTNLQNPELSTTVVGALSDYK